MSLSSSSSIKPKVRGKSVPARQDNHSLPPSSNSDWTLVVNRSKIVPVKQSSHIVNSHKWITSSQFAEEEEVVKAAQITLRNRLMVVAPSVSRPP